MSSSPSKERPLIRRTVAARVVKAVAVTLGFAFLAAVLVLAWLLRTGRAAEYMRQDILSTLERECGVRAAFDAISVGALDREVVLERLRIESAAGGATLLAVERAKVVVDLLPLFYGRYELGRVELIRPEARIFFAGGRVRNLPTCLAAAESTGDAPRALGLRYLRIEGGRFDLEVDDGTQAKLSGFSFYVSPGRAGGLDLRGELPQVALRLKDRNLNLEHIEARGHLDGPPPRPRALNIDRMTGVVEGIEVFGHGTLDFLGPVYEVRVGVRGMLDRLAGLFPELPPAEGRVSLDVAVVGTWLQPRATGEVLLEGVRVGKYGSGDRTTASFEADPSGVEFRSVEVRLGEGEVKARGRVAFDEALSFTVDLQTEGASLARILDQTSVRGSWCDLLMTGHADLSGTLNPVDLKGDVDWQVRRLVVRNVAWDNPAAARAQRFLALGPAQLRGRWRFDERALSFLDVSIIRGATEVDADAYIGFASGLDIDARFTNLHLEDLGGIAGLELAGVGTAFAELEGRYRSLALAGTFDLSQVFVGRTPLGRVAGVVSWDGGVALDFTGLRGRLGQSPYDASVAVALRDDVPLRITGRVHRGRLEDALTAFRVDGGAWGRPKGMLATRFDLQGPIGRLTGPLVVELKRASIWGESFETARMSGRMDRGRVVADALELKKGRGRLLGAGSIRPRDGAVNLDVRTVGLRLQDVDEVKREAGALTGGLSARLALGGRLAALTGTATVKLRNVRAGDVPVGRGTFLGRVRGRSVHLQGALGRLRVEKARVDLRPRLPYAGVFLLDDMNVPGIVSALRRARPVQGAVSLRADLEGRVLDWRHSTGEVVVSRAVTNLDKLSLELATPTRFEVMRGGVSARRLAVTGPRTRLVVDGRFGREAVDLRVKGRLDLGLAELAGDVVQKGGGTLFLDAALGGTTDRLELVGTGRVEGGLLQLAGFEDRLTGYSAALTFSQSSVLIDRSEGRWAGGRLLLAGAVHLEGFRPSRLALEVDIRDARPRFVLESVDVTGTVGGRVTLSGPLRRTMVRGALDLTRGEIRPKIDWLSLVGTPVIADVYDPSSELLDLDIALHARSPVRVRNEDMDVEMTGEVRLTGTNERIGLLGTGNVEGGRVILLGREYTIQQGLVEFRDRYRFEPRYDFTGSSGACGARIGLNIVGTLQSFEIVYTSNPEMAQNDIVSCLIRGVKVSELDRDLTSFAGSALLKLSGVDREVRKVIPVDQIDVTTEYSSLTRAYEPRIVIGKNLRLLDRPARLEYSTSLLRSNDQRAALRLGLAERLNLQLGWTSSEDVPYGDWGLDLRQRWEW